MQAIRKLDEIAERLKSKNRKYRVAVALAEDSNTLNAVYRAVSEGFVHALMIGNPEKINAICAQNKVNPEIFEIIAAGNDIQALEIAVSMVKNGEADVLMKGLVGTDKFLKAVLNKESGLMKKGKIMSYVCALELPDYHKLLFISDTAVLTFPELKERKVMIEYTVNMAQRFGIARPKVALISATEKVSPAMPSTIDDAMLSKMADRGQIKGCEVDGPMDVFIACDAESARIKGVESPVAGDADALIFPSLESCNSFYKGLMLFGKGELAGLIQGTEKPVVVMSRSESEKSKFYCIALACLMAE